MKRALLRTLALVGVVAAWLIATPIHAQTTGVGPYYATPSWDQQLPASTRFIVLSNWNSEAVLDRETGLVWERDPTTARGNPNSISGNWGVARSLCAQAKTGGRAAWRLPSFHELASLVDPSAGLPVGHPFLNVPTGIFNFYWSATSETGTNVVAFAVSFHPGSGVFSQFQDESGRIWCVRGGGPLHQY